MIDSPTPGALALLPNYPNPFRPIQDDDTTIAFELNQSSQITSLSIYTADGALVRRFDLGARSARRYTVRWNGKNEEGVLVGSGLYHYVLEAAGQHRRATLALIRD
jgi:flagellar hook assembly protein FlgD